MGFWPWIGLSSLSRLGGPDADPLRFPA